MLESAMGKLARVVSRDFGLTVTFKGSGAYVNLEKKQMVLPALSDDRIVEIINGYLDHEAGHVRFTSEKFKFTSVKSKLEEELIRVLEDVRVDNKMRGLFLGCGANIDKTRLTIYDKVKKSVAESGDPEGTFWMDILENMAGRLDFSDMCSTAQFGVLSALDLFMTLPACKDIFDVQNLSREIAKRWDAMPPPGMGGGEDEDEDGDEDGEGMDGEGSGKGKKKDRKKDKKKSKKDKKEAGRKSAENPFEDKDKDEEGDEDGDDGDGSGDGSGEGDEDGKGKGGGGSEDDAEGQDGDGEGEGKGNGSEDAEGDGDDGDDAGDGAEAGEQPHPSEGPRESFGKGVSGGTGGALLDLEQVVKLGIELAVKDVVMEVGHSKHIPYTTEDDEIRDARPSEWNSGKDEHIRKKARSATGVLQKRLEMALMAKDRARFRYELDRGKIDPRRLHALTSRTSNKVFKKRVEAETMATAVYLLVDCSGSMASGGKMGAAREAACAFSDCLDRLGIPHEVAGFWTGSKYTRRGMGGVDYSKLTRDDYETFNRFGESINHMVVKGFDKQFKDGHFSALDARYNNTDGESVRVAARILAKRPEKRKVLIVFSDGNPVAEGKQALLYKDLREAVQEINAAGIHTIGIGIKTDAPKKFYPDNVQINDITQLSAETMKQLEDILLKGKGMVHKGGRAA